MNSLQSRLNESLSNDCIGQILKVCESDIADMVNSSINVYEKQFDTVATKYDYENFRLKFIYKLLIALSKNIMSSDTLINCSINGSMSGSLIINATIERSNISYQFSTSVIYAGGYNIQMLHYRYIVSTTLPKSTSMYSELSVIKEKIKKLSKAEKINVDIERFNKYITHENTAIDKILSMTDDQKLETSAISVMQPVETTIGLFKHPSWEVLVLRKAHAIEMYKTKETYEHYVADEKHKHLQSYDENVKDRKQRIIYLQKEKAKYQRKLDDLVSSIS